jgi:hypothetical protein
LEASCRHSEGEIQGLKPRNGSQRLGERKPRDAVPDARHTGRRKVSV